MWDRTGNNKKKQSQLQNPVFTLKYDPGFIPGKLLNKKKGFNSSKYEEHRPDRKFNRD
jgi:hypothetical protein